MTKNELLEKDDTLLAIEMYTVKSSFCSSITEAIFCRNTGKSFSPRNKSDLRAPHVSTVYHGSESSSEVVPEELKVDEAVDLFFKQF